MSNTPRFNVYVTPPPLTLTCQKLYTPPPHEDAFVAHLQRYGYLPSVNAVQQPHADDVVRLCGLVYLHERQELIPCALYKEGAILCIQWYNEPLTLHQLECIAAYMKPFYCLDGGLDCTPEEFEALNALGCFATVEPQKSTLAPEFIGSCRL